MIRARWRSGAATRTIGPLPFARVKPALVCGALREESVTQMMVTPYDGTRLFATLQTEHSRIAGFLASRWGNDRFALPEPWDSVVLAAQEHDRAWWLWECRPTLTDTGEPLDYQNNTLHHLGELRTTIYRNAVSDIAPIDPYAALLILVHLTGIITAGNGAYSFRKDLSENPIAKAYLQNQREVKEALVAAIRRSPEFRGFSSDAQLEDNAKLVEVFDALAQFLCNRYPLSETKRGGDPNRQFAEFPVPTRPGEPDARLVLRVLDDYGLGIDPYPFCVSPLPVDFMARWLPNRTYSSRQAFLEDFYRAEPIAVHYQVQGI
jgi:hypothetical protein